VTGSRKLKDVELRFITGPRGPAIETLGCPALGFVLSMDGNRPDAWFLLTLAEGLRAVLAREVPGYSVAQDEVSADITPDSVEIVVSELPDGTAMFREPVPTWKCAEVVARWQTYLQSFAGK
jgi:hypothetical protein